MTYKNVRLQGKDPAHANAMRCNVFDADTGEDITDGIVWADDEKGEYEVLLRNERGDYYKDEATDNAATEIIKRNIRIEVPVNG